MAGGSPQLMIWKRWQPQGRCEEVAVAGKRARLCRRCSRCPPSARRALHAP